MSEIYEPVGTRFFDKKSSREMILILEGHSAGWIAYRHPDGQWVALRKATEDDIARINRAVIEAHH